MDTFVTLAIPIICFVVGLLVGLGFRYWFDQ
jgi:hypothetical protein